MGSDWGPVIGSVSIVWLNDILGYFEKYQLLAYGILLILFIVFLPGGVVGEGKKLVAKINELIKGAKNRKEVDAGA